MKHRTYNNKKFHVSRFKFHKDGGFTLIEVIIIVLILSLISAISITNFVILQEKSELDNSVQEFAGILRLAQSKTLASEDSSQYGVYLDILASPHQYILFKGTSYALRDATYDQFYFLPKTIEFFAIALGGGNEIVFNRLTGSASQSGSLSLRVKTDTSQQKTVYISGSGVVSFSPPAAISDTRLKDSRHLHFDYNGDINNKIINLTFDDASTPQKQIQVSQNLDGYGQLDWLGTISVGGSNQTLRIHTHSLSGVSAQFSIHRDRRYNNKSLKITISGDSSGSLAEYSADGLTTTFSSIYVSNFAWQ